MKSNVVRLIATVFTAIVIGLSVMLASPLTAAAGGGGGGTGGIFCVAPSTDLWTY
ncbi:MAG TPA: hypothetical protein VGK87_00030 [Anaerolineae bacterium]|jgi:hypothetical protein